MGGGLGGNAARIQRCCYDRAAQGIVAPTLGYQAATILGILFSSESDISQTKTTQTLTVL